ncbi:MAG: hypothetical protein NT061_00860 [Spirochaetes bacterium]|nr:hypothetical protein [Spirochaetota bacterium]
MKKLIVLLLALSMAGAVFAQAAAVPAPALTFGAYGDAEADLYNSTATTTGTYSLYTETYFNYKATDMAFSATTIGSSDMFAAFRNYSLTYNLAPAFGLQLKAGKLREAPARLSSYIDGNGFSTRSANSEEGVEVLGAVSGFTAAVFCPVGTNGYKFAGGVSYAVPDLVTVVGGYRMVNSEAWVGVDVKAVKGLTAKVGFKNVGTANTIYFTAGSSSLVPGFNLGLDGNFSLTPAIGYSAKVMIQYALNPFAVGLKASYDNGVNNWYGNNGVDVNPYVMMNFAAGDVKLGVNYNAVTGKIYLPLECELSF